MHYISTDDEFADVASRLGGAPLVAADTEAAGYHRYLDTICLLQLTAGGDTYVVDTLALESLDPLRPVFEARGTEVVFHDADYDLRLLHRDHGMTVEGLFDTRIAAQFAGISSIGLASLLEELLGVKVAKKFQRADWARRPLPREMLEYAAEDTRHLPELRDRLREELERLGRLGWAEEEFRQVEGTRWDETEEAEEFMRHKGIQDLGPRQLAALRELHEWRESKGRERDRATFRILSREPLVEVARQLPASAEELSRIQGIPARMARSDWGGEMLEAVRRAHGLAESELPRHPPRGPRRPRPEPAFEERVERLKAVRDAAADRLEVDRGFLMARWQYEEIAREEPRTLEELAAIGSVRRWQVEAFGEEILAAI